MEAGPAGNGAANPTPRNSSEIDLVLGYAKLPKSDLKPLVQNVRFSEDLDNDQLCLLELQAPVVDSLTAGDEVVIRGDKDDVAVLCTKDRTYEIKEAETSNSLLILPICSVGKDIIADGEQHVEDRQIVSQLHNYYELRLCKPKLKKMRTLLEENVYSGAECEDDEDHQSPKYTIADFLNVVQASEEETRAALIKCKACEIGGFWRVLDFDFLTQILSHIIQLAEENNWINSAVPLGACCETLEELYSRQVIEHTLRCYSDKCEDPSLQNLESSSELYYKLSEDKICRFFAELTLRNSGKFNFQEFMDVWQQSVPESLKTSLSQIEGMALIDRHCKPEVIWYFPVEALPDDVAPRFNFLFKTKEKWTLEEIAPYIRDLEGEKADVGTLLMKHARASTQKGVRVFSSRKPIT